MAVIFPEWTNRTPKFVVTALAFVAVELLIPAWVFVDLRRREDEPSGLWVHAVAMPLVNVFGLLGYLEERRRSRGG